MYDQVHEALEAYRPLWENTASFSESVMRFEQKRDIIHDMNKALVKKSKWMTKYKNLLLDECLDEGYKLIRYIKVYAVKNGLKKEVLKYSISKREFTSGFLSDKLGRLTDLLTDLQLYAAELLSLGLTQVRLDSFAVKVTELDEYANVPRQKNLERSQLNDELKVHIKTTNFILKEELDVLIELFASTASAFTVNYFKARNIIDKHSKLKPASVDDGPERDDGEESGFDPEKPLMK